ncbi:hypothetical protein MP228_001375 [Amoeboaphelidium protococcarum]|nr:hypothetical protein MP228_001375 [Amoeboaphelidium protococcarum]
MAQVNTTGHGMLQSNSSSSLVYTVAQQMEAYVSYQPNLIETQQDILQFWEGAGSVQFLVLAKIVVKILCMPATSVPSEEAFSRADFMISYRSNRLSYKMFKICMLLKSKYQMLILLLLVICRRTSLKWRNSARAIMQQINHQQSYCQRF